MRCAAFSKRHGQHARVSFQIVKVLANAEHATFALHVAVKGLADLGLGQRIQKDVTRNRAHGVCH